MASNDRGCGTRCIANVGDYDLTVGNAGDVIVIVEQDAELFVLACDSGEVGTAAALATKNGITPEQFDDYRYFEAYDNAHGRGDLKMCRWLVTTFDISLDQIGDLLPRLISWSAYQGHRELLDWFIGHYRLVPYVREHYDELRSNTGPALDEYLVGSYQESEFPQLDWPPVTKGALIDP